MPSFDVVSKIDMQELDNAMNQARKEIGARFDFQGTDTHVELAGDKQTINLRANSDGRIRAAVDVLISKLTKRGVSLHALDYGKILPAQNGHVKQTVTLIQGINTEKAKKLVAVVKEAKLKVQASIQGDALRVTGKNKDDLQAAMRLIRAQQEELEIDLQFNNFRD